MNLLSKNTYLSLLSLTFLSACVTTNTLKVESSNISILRSVPISVAVAIPEESRKIAMATVGQTGCWGTPSAPGPFGQIFSDTVRDRFARLFDNAQIVNSPAEAAGVDAIFEARLEKVEWAGGCLISPDGFFSAKGSFKAIDESGRAIWTSNRTESRQQVGMVANLELGTNFGQRISGLVDGWVQELQILPVQQYALDENIQVPETSRYARSNSVRNPVISQARTATPVRQAIAPKFPMAPLDLKFKKVSEQPDAIGVIIANADYSKLAKDIPDVAPAYADALSVKRYFTQGLGIKEGNIIDLKDATGSQMIRVFGSAINHRGQLHDWIKPGKSKVYIYYAGHGAPSNVDGSAYLVPSDADASRIDLNGYSLKTLYDNLAKLDTKEATVILEACFSGASQGGTLVKNASPIFLKPKKALVPDGITVIAAGAPDQIASWEENKSHGLFTQYYLKAMAGAADENKNGKITNDELDTYLKDTMTYYARRYYGRDQVAQIVKGR